MTESSKSKLWSFAGLFLQLLLVTVLWVFLTSALLISLVIFRINSLLFWKGIFWELQTLLLLAGYTWTIYYRLRLTGVTRLLTSIALGILATGVAYFIFFVLFIVLAEIFNFTTV